jgi:hypothetical protein
MKYVISWVFRPGITEEAAARSLQVFSKWSPSEPERFREFLGRVDGQGGFAVVETDDPAKIARDVGPFGAWFEFTVTPVLDIQETAAISFESLEFLGSIS